MTPTTTALSGLSFAGILRSEWVKFVSLRSTIWCYTIMVVLTIGLGLLVAATIPDPVDVGTTQNTWVTITTLGVGFGQLVIAVLGVLVITGEFGTGMIRSTFAAVPTRLPALAGKGLVLGATTFLVSFVALVATALLVGALLSGRGLAVDFGDGDVWLALVGAAGYLTLVGALSLGIGTILRNSAVGIATALGLLLVLPTVMQIIAGITRTQLASDLGTFLPSSAGARMFAYPTLVESPPRGFERLTEAITPILLEPWQGFLVMLAWAVVALGVGANLLRYRDA